MGVTFALAAGGLVFLLFIIVLIAAVIWGLYTRAGSNIAQRPSDGLAHGDQPPAPGSSAPDRIVGAEAGEQDPFDSRGAR